MALLISYPVFGGVHSTTGCNSRAHKYSTTQLKTGQEINKGFTKSKSEFVNSKS